MNRRSDKNCRRVVKGVAVLGLTGVLLSAVPCVLPGGSAAWAQDAPSSPVEDLLNAEGHRVMPEGWQEMSLEALVSEFDRYFSAPWPDPVERDAVITHVWQTYLSDEAFIAGADWSVVEPLVRVIGSRLAVPGGLTTQADRSALAGRFSTRVASEMSGGQMDFEVMRVALDTLAQQGVSQRERAALAAGWCDGRDLSGLTLRQQAVLCDVLRDSVVDPRNMSGVYEGTITIPQAGAYTFDRYLADGVYANDWVVVQVGGQVVLDTRPNEDGDATLRGPVDLPAGGQTFTATFFRGDDTEVGDDVGRVEHVLRWKTPGSREEDAAVLVPGGVFGQAGLTASYFAGPAEGEPVMEQTVPGVDRIGSSFGQRHGALLDQIRGQLTSPQRVAGWYQELEDDSLAAPTQLAWVFQQACASMGVADRVALTDAVCGQHPGWVGTMDSGWYMKTAMWSLAGVPPEADGGGAMATLVGTWAANRPRYQTRIGYFPGWGGDSYLKLNDDAHAHLGYVLGGYASQWPVMLAIIEESMAEPDGSCDLDIFKLYLETAKIADRVGNGHGLAEVTAEVDRKLEDDTLSGDAKATWLVARGICQQAAAIDKIPVPTYGITYFEQALASAESVEVRFWALNEIMARLISVGEGQWAESILASIEHQFPPLEVAPGMFDAEESPMTYADVFRGWRELAPIYEENAEASRVARLRQEDLGRVRSEIEDLEGSVAELESIQDDAARGATARRVLTRLRQDLEAANALLEAMKNEDAAQ